jgi:prepilin-type N-terminal cleavage/methylation domain-containing protein/prepilin-type processing-associated H-X9-DG protein
MKTTLRQRTAPKTLCAFTLIELLTVIAIIAVLAAILIPAVSAVRAKSRAAHSVSNLRQIGTSLNLYTSENKGYYPYVSISAADWNSSNPDQEPITGSQAWSKLLRNYLPQRGQSLQSVENLVFVCPNAEYFDAAGNTFEFNDTSRTYSATEALYGLRVLGSGRVTFDTKARRLAMSIIDPAKTILVIDAKQQTPQYASSRSGILWKLAQADLGASSPEQTVNIDFRQPGNEANALYADGHVGQISFDSKNEISEPTWTGRDI